MNRIGKTERNFQNNIIEEETIAICWTGSKERALCFYLKKVKDNKHRYNLIRVRWLNILTIWEWKIEKKNIKEREKDVWLWWIIMLGLLWLTDKVVVWRNAQRLVTVGGDCIMRDENKPQFAEYATWLPVVVCCCWLMMMMLWWLLLLLPLWSYSLMVVAVFVYADRPAQFLYSSIQLYLSMKCSRNVEESINQQWLVAIWSTRRSFCVEDVCLINGEKKTRQTSNLNATRGEPIAAVRWK